MDSARKTTTSSATAIGSWRRRGCGKRVTLLWSPGRVTIDTVGLPRLSGPSDVYVLPLYPFRRYLGVAHDVERLQPVLRLVEAFTESRWEYLG